VRDADPSPLLVP